MKLFYYQDPSGNFGDDLNEILFGEMASNCFDNNDAELFVGIGTLINSKLPLDSKKIVFGSGVGYGRLPVVDSSFTFLFVRGPLSAAALLGASEWITDPAILVKDLELAEQCVPARGLFIPHHASDSLADWGAVCERVGLKYASPSLSPLTILSEIKASEYVLTEAMHGAICADALGVPWTPLAIYPHIDKFKWIDWTSSMDVAYAPVEIPPVWDGDHALSKGLKRKVAFKRLLLGAGVWRGAWDLPPLKHDTRFEYDAAEFVLRELIKNAELHLSSRNMSESKHSQVLEKLSTFQKSYL